MVATVGIQEINGVPNGTFTDLTSARYSTGDSAAPGLTNAIPIPSAGAFNNSFWKSHTLVMSGSFTQIDNIRWYTDGTIGWNYGTSGNLYIGVRASGDIGAPISNSLGTTHQYTQASGTVGTTGIPITSGHPYYSFINSISGRMAVASTYVVGSPATVDSGAHATQGDRSKIIVTQVVVDDDATQGSQNPETVTFRYDEI